MGKWISLLIVLDHLDFFFDKTGLFVESRVGLGAVEDRLVGPGFLGGLQSSEDDAVGECECGSEGKKQDKKRKKR